ncbi:hypothetical protein [Sphingomicrobium nitratireducens]|uniref:hypothetical protein n=1 Tax=Sphingomicrobium nitratireducens TaxID=2964666 RepID=UPI00223FB606|nr:hypothetical protein [Sphingomicrobium nitratireducens]
MWPWFLVGLAALYAGAAASRRAKRRIAERAWRNALPARFEDELASMGYARAEAHLLAPQLAEVTVRELMSGFNVRDFSGLIHALAKTGGGRQAEIEMRLINALVRKLPRSIDRGLAQSGVSRALRAAGSDAMRAARQSSHV